jgi:hypothetical protein
MTESISEIPHLLHDARLIDCSWDELLRSVTLTFECLRRNVDGTEIENRSVDIVLSNVTQVIAYYSPASAVIRPSEFKVKTPITLRDLSDWPYKGREAHLAINSPRSQFELQTACVRDVLLGEEEEVPLQVSLLFETNYYGPDGATSSLRFSCDSLQPFTNGVPLDIGLWEKQFRAWWGNWRDHWAEKTEDDEQEQEPALENTFIPAGLSDAPDLTYEPPPASPFQIVPTDAPAKLLQPIENYHTGIFERNWRQAALAYLNLDQTIEERIEQFEQQHLGWDSGRWIYIRQVDSWWCEGDRACVVARGIEHTKSDDEGPSTNKEAVISYGLFKYEDRWVINTWSQGWPEHGSAEKVSEPQDWRDGWNLAN